MQTNPLVLPVMLWLVVCCFTILLLFGMRLMQSTDLKHVRQFASPLAAVALPIVIVGLWIALTDSLLEPFTLAIGGPLLYGGCLLVLGSAFIARANTSALEELMLPTFVGGIFFMMLAIAIAIYGTTHATISPPLTVIWAGAYGCSGIAAMCSKGFARVVWQRVAMFALFAALILFVLLAVIISF